MLVRNSPAANEGGPGIYPRRRGASARRSAGRPDVRHLVDDFATQLALVAGGVVALIPRLGRPPIGADLVVRPVHPSPAREVTLVWRTSAADSPAVRAVADALTGPDPDDAGR